MHTSLIETFVRPFFSRVLAHAATAANDDDDDGDA